MPFLSLSLSLSRARDRSLSLARAVSLTLALPPVLLFSFLSLSLTHTHSHTLSLSISVFFTQNTTKRHKQQYIKVLSLSHLSHFLTLYLSSFDTQYQKMTQPTIYENSLSHTHAYTLTRTHCTTKWLNRLYTRIPSISHTHTHARTHCTTKWLTDYTQEYPLFHTHTHTHTQYHKCTLPTTKTFHKSLHVWRLWKVSISGLFSHRFVFFDTCVGHQEHIHPCLATFGNPWAVFQAISNPP